MKVLPLEKATHCVLRKVVPEDTCLHISLADYTLLIVRRIVTPIPWMLVPGKSWITIRYIFLLKGETKMLKNFRNLHPVDRFSRIAIVACGSFLSVSTVVVGATTLFGL
jgi:hypothetical protein